MIGLGTALRARVAIGFITVAAVLVFARTAAVCDAYQYYFGNTHSHSFYSDGSKTPAQHYATAKSCGYDFYCVTDHSLQKYLFSPETYAETKREADQYTDGTFVGIVGFEFTGAGHATALNADGYLDSTGLIYDLKPLYDWLVKNQTSTVACAFSHPYADSYNSYAYLTPARRDEMTMLEMINLAEGSLHYPAFIAALEKGWRVAPIAAEDGHGTWRIPQDQFRTGVLAPSLTRENIMQAMRERRVYCTWDKNLRLSLSANGRIMGSVLPKTSTLDISITASDPDTADPNEQITRIDIVGDRGVTLCSRDFSAHSVSWDLVLPAKCKYYFAQVWSADKTDGPTAYSAPIWVGASTQPPAAPSQLMATVVTSTRIDLSWSGGIPGNSGFKIERKIGDGQWHQCNNIDSSYDSYSDTGLRWDTTYYYRVRAFNDAGNSDYSNVSSAVTMTPFAERSAGVRLQGSKLGRDGQPFLPLGFSLAVLQSSPAAGEAQQHCGQAEMDTARSWRANTLRFVVSQRSLDPADPLYSCSYAQRVRDSVALARRNGFAVILAMQDAPESGGGTAMPYAQTLRAWDELAKQFNDDSSVMYELWTDPSIGDTASEWETWRGGGSIGGTAVIGHQQIVNRLRANGSKNLLIAVGARSGRSLAGCPGLSDPLDRLAYGIHPYLVAPLTDQPGWDRCFGNWAASHPVIATEWCADSANPMAQPQWPSLAPQLVDYLLGHGIGLIAWAFDAPGTVIRDWSWTPTSFAGFTCGIAGCGPGELIKQRFGNCTSAPAVDGNGLGSSIAGKADNSYVSYSGLVISQQISGPDGRPCVYLQSRNRIAAIKALIPQSAASERFSPGELLDVSGYLGSEREIVNKDGLLTWGDRVLNVIDYRRNGSMAAPSPLYMQTKSAVGGWTRGDAQQGAYHGGPNNLGLYIRVIGNVTCIVTNPNGSIAYFYIDDGCSILDGTSHGSPSVPNIGLRVIVSGSTPGVPPAGFAVGAKVGINGCSALELVGRGGDNGIPALRIAEFGQLNVY